MKSRILLTILFLTLSSASFAEVIPPANSTNQNASKPQMDPAVMEAMKKASTPGAEHQMLQQFVGKWDYTIKWWMTPQSQPEVSKGTSNIESILDHRFIRQTAQGTSMGQPFKGVGISGYDNIQKHFSSVWMDNMGTAMMVGKGEFDKAKNAIVDKGNMSCPMSATGERAFRNVMYLPKNNSFKYEMYTNDDSGKEFQMMEIVYTKAK